VAFLGEHLRAGRHERDPVLVVLDLLRNSDDHPATLPADFGALRATDDKLPEMARLSALRSTRASAAALCSARPFEEPERCRSARLS
jgi:hypothetical protein